MFHVRCLSDILLKFWLELCLCILAENCLGRWLVPKANWFLFLNLFLEDFQDMQFEVENSEWLELSCKARIKRWNKKSQWSSFFWKQLYSSSGLTAARTACSATQEKINFNVISMPIYVHIKVSFYSFCLMFSGQVLQVVPLLYQ